MQCIHMYIAAGRNIPTQQQQADGKTLKNQQHLKYKRKNEIQWI